MKKKILLAVAPVAHETKTIPAGITNPVTCDQIAREVIGCANLGVSMVHLHVRNDEGKQVKETEYFSTTIDLIRKQSDIVIQGSTGGVADLSLEERCVSLNDKRVESASLNMGSTNFFDGVYINTIPDIRYWAQRMIEEKVKPELEVFDLSFLNSIKKIENEGLLTEPLMYNFSLGFENSLEASADNLFLLKQAIQGSCSWGLIHESSEDMALLATAAGMGASALRFGYEDSFYFKKDELATSNVVLAEKLIEILDLLGYEPMTPKEAREHMGIPQISNL